MRTQTREIALTGMLSALAVVLLSLGGILPLATYAAPILASVAILAAREECRRSYAWSCFASSAALGLLLSPDKEGAALFAFLGWYPLLKPRLDRLCPLPLRFAVKLLVCAVPVGAMYALLLFAFRLDAVVQEFAQTAPSLLLLTVALGFAVFLVYDLALARLTTVLRGRRRR